MGSSLLTKRMKEQYELRARHYLPRRTYVIVRCDGRAFHTWTRGLEKPYSLDLMACMDAAAIALCKEAAGARLAYVQSDEISLLLTDFADPKTEAWFDNCQNKIETISASIVTSAFNLAVVHRQLLPEDQQGKICGKRPNAVFDARAFVIPDLIEVENYFIDRQQDAARNSVTMLAQSHASHKVLHGKNQAAQHDIIVAAGDNWANHPARFKHGGVIHKKIEPPSPAALHPSNINAGVRESNWFMDENTPVFTKDRDYLRNMVPVIWDNDLLTRMTDNRKGTE